jgi:hypothetical protein
MIDSKIYIAAGLAAAAILSSRKKPTTTTQPVTQPEAQPDDESGGGFTAAGAIGDLQVQGASPLPGGAPPPPAVVRPAGAVKTARERFQIAAPVSGEFKNYVLKTDAANPGDEEFIVNEKDPSEFLV